jgi:purine nucleoside phosphorylase
MELQESDVVSHEEVLAVGKKKADVMKMLVERIIELVHTS